MTAELKKASMEVQAVKRWARGTTFSFSNVPAPWNLPVPTKTYVGIFLISWWFPKYDLIFK